MEDSQCIFVEEDSQVIFEEPEAGVMGYHSIAADLPKATTPSRPPVAFLAKPVEPVCEDSQTSTRTPEPTLQAPSPKDPKPISEILGLGNRNRFVQNSPARRSDDESTLNLGFWDKPEEPEKSITDDPYGDGDQAVAGGDEQGGDQSGEGVQVDGGDQGVAGKPDVQVDGDDQGVAEKPGGDHGVAEKPADQVDGGDEGVAVKPRGQADGGEGEQPAKRLRLADMTPNSKAQEEKRRLEQKRASSRAWRAKYTKKGVLKSDAADAQVEPSAPAAGEPSAPAAGEPSAPAAGHDGDAFQPSESLSQQALGSDMRAVRAAFINEWIEKNRVPEKSWKDLNSEASAAWMQSGLRAQILAARKGEHY